MIHTSLALRLRDTPPNAFEGFPVPSPSAAITDGDAMVTAVGLLMYYLVFKSLVASNPFCSYRLLAIAPTEKA